MVVVSSGVVGEKLGLVIISVYLVICCIVFEELMVGSLCLVCGCSMIGLLLYIVGVVLN